MSVTISLGERRQASILFDEPAAAADDRTIMALAAGVRMKPSKTGLGRAYVFEHDGVRCAITVSNASNAVDGILCEAL